MQAAKLITVLPDAEDEGELARLVETAFLCAQEAHQAIEAAVEAQARLAEQEAQLDDMARALSQALELLAERNAVDDRVVALLTTVLAKRQPKKPRYEE
jgi:hypothetical protein